MAVKKQISFIEKLRRNWVVILLAVLLLITLTYIFWPVDTKEDETLNEGVARIIDSVMQVNTFKLIQAQREEFRKADSARAASDSKDKIIVEKYYERDKKIAAVDTATDDVMQSLWDDRYPPKTSRTSNH